MPTISLSVLFSFTLGLLGGLIFGIIFMTNRYGKELDALKFSLNNVKARYSDLEKRTQEFLDQAEEHIDTHDEYWEAKQDSP